MYCLIEMFLLNQWNKIWKNRQWWIEKKSKCFEMKMKRREIEQKATINVIQRCNDLNWCIDRWNSQTKQQRRSFHQFHLSDKSKMKTKMNQKMIEQLNERMETKSNIQTCCLEKKMKQRNEWWMVERKTLIQWSSSESTKSFK